jgi:hypothetical protein
MVSVAEGNTPHLPHGDIGACSPAGSFVISATHLLETQTETKAREEAMPCQDVACFILAAPRGPCHHGFN